MSLIPRQQWKNKSTIICPSRIWFSFNYTSSSSANLLKIIHKAKDYKKPVKFDFDFFHSRAMPLDEL